MSPAVSDMLLKVADDALFPTTTMITSLALLVVNVTESLLTWTGEATTALPSRAIPVPLPSKLAVSVTGLFMVIGDVGLEVPLKQPAPLQDQLWKVNPVFGV